jgi:phosphoglycolate phosphatase-like HAD superfamily hydrolase
VPASRKWIEADAYVFDIDGTLLNAYGGAHYNSFHSALQKHFGLQCKIDGVPLHGNTDTGILRAVLAREGVAAAEFDAKRAAIFAEMCEEVEKNREQVRSELCPGIARLLQHLRQRKRLLGLATGNLERIGWIKVETAGVRDYFSFGAFSDGHETRADIFRDALNEVRKRLGDAAVVCFVGDTIHDVTAAQASGAPVIAVATGIFSFEQLAESQPDVCVRSCEDLLEHIPAEPS